MAVSGAHFSTMAQVSKVLLSIFDAYSENGTLPQSNKEPHNCINVRDPLYFLGYGIPYIYVKRILFPS